MENENNLVNRIYSLLSTMSPIDKKISEVVLNVPEQVMDMTISQLAIRADVSQASISRYCKMLGMNGFHQFKTRLAQLSNEDVGYYKEITADNIQESLNSISNNKNSEIYNTLNNFSTTVIERILNLLSSARIIQVIAEGNTFPVAVDAAYKLNQLGIFSIATDLWETSLAQTLNLDDNDLLMVISNTGASKNLISQMQLAKNRHISIISLTSNPESPIAELADAHLNIAVRQKVLRSDYYFSKIAVSAAIESIFLLLLSRDESRVERIKFHEDLISDKKV
ncbi:MurR/RpiR family transcriptional regulator [Leuconostoc mesenteroides]|uniref:MurR/RpiR family transcriptional regulator n=1 Tax=Leuconostoc mesenteroides TaxID=1245 RepID=UPI0021C17FCD|nr:MurR/RpiR family transcriptional regulator [Leuconostoc mesenteroides]MCT8385665.1 MurR/RpiR family transcriptional regulator [Leuconostoc mesenteroides]